MPLDQVKGLVDRIFRIIDENLVAKKAQHIELAQLIEQLANAAVTPEPAPEAENVDA